MDTKDEIIAELRAENTKLRQALKDIIDFQWNAWTRAKKLLEEIGSCQNEFIYREGTWKRFYPS